jgi:uncharacterized protein YecE (DUF72 family)
MKQHKNQNMIHIGTSGWHYQHWKGHFYPADLPERDMLHYYINHFSCVEINNSFYQLPQEKTISKWYAEVPESFIFTVKGSRYITHMKKLKNSYKSSLQFLDRVNLLENKLGPILFQLPPRWKCNPERLNEFLETLPKEYRYAFEFRDPSWFNEEIYKILKIHSAAFCIYDFNQRQSPKEITTDFVYLRLHGPSGPYEGSYSRKNLSRWIEHLCVWAKKRIKIYCFFDNDQKGYAVQDAIKLKKMTVGMN